MTFSRLASGIRRRERGATAIEFALMLPVFFLILYAIITYGMIFAAQQNLTLAATEGARAALNYQQVGAAASVPAAQQAALAARAQAACTAATNLTTWLKGATCTPTQQGSCSYDTTMLCVQITLTYPYSQNPLVPPFPLLGSLLPVPSALVGTAMVQISPVNIL
ncbi:MULTISPECIES: TadE/TadG family type IV pilus assembly protein [Burkholderia]|uniref:TadE/TadG family type IV pilus assembly protein n=1 Tax=Burkholderia TaxID=32008 RepID=UPI00066866D1|nr:MULTISPECIES: TadE family protein [Burkholderia]MBJ9592480.1 pilus assembly protein [Burkholderia seminalis]MBN3738703.1 pilus assembly protein [Burkholderia sp. Tr-20355]MCA8432384.1 pilus assembly protein [Burkholderia seminalis]RQS84282.1 pilus assembly protein [Burkholderia seminalis]VWB18048.1 pilus assembly protein TadE [Burkholderia seminalis]